MDRKNYIKVVDELLYRINDAKQYLDLCAVHNEMGKDNGKYIQKYNIARNYFNVANQAGIVALMIEIGKLCEQRKKDSPISFYKLVDDLKNDGYLCDNSIKYVIENNDLEENECCIKNIKLRRDKIYAHNDKEYFIDIFAVKDNGSVTYQEMGVILNKMENICKAIYLLLTKKEWKQAVRQNKMFSPKRDCHDLFNLLDCVQ